MCVYVGSPFTFDPLKPHTKRLPSLLNFFSYIHIVDELKKEKNIVRTNFWLLLLLLFFKFIFAVAGTHEMIIEACDSCIFRLRFYFIVIRSN